MLHKPHHPHQHPHEWIQSEEMERSIKEIGQRIQKIGNLISKKGELKLNQSIVKPSDPSKLIVRYERLPHGELCLKIEIVWEEINNVNERADYSTELEID